MWIFMHFPFSRTPLTSVKYKCYLRPTNPLLIQDQAELYLLDPLYFLPALPQFYLLQVLHKNYLNLFFLTSIKFSK
jgi:hypothetical protein